MTATASHSQSKAAVLVVDDDDHVLRAIRVVLSRRYNVVCCNDPEQAVDQLRACAANAVLLDVRMPKHNGFWVYEQIRKEYKDVPIIFNSAYQDAMDGQDAQGSYRPFAYLSKGGDMAEFLKTIAAAVQAYDPRKR